MIYQTRKNTSYGLQIPMQRTTKSLTYYPDSSVFDKSSLKAEKITFCFFLLIEKQILKVCFSVDTRQNSWRTTIICIF